MATMLVVIDQFTKALIMSEFDTGAGVVVTDFFNIVRVHNYGAAFSFLDPLSWCSASNYISNTHCMDTMSTIPYAV